MGRLSKEDQVTARDFSQMPVQFDTEDNSVMRCVRNKGYALTRGAFVDVEVGAIWRTIGGRQQRVGGNGGNAR